MSRVGDTDAKKRRLARTPTLDADFVGQRIAICKHRQIDARAFQDGSLLTDLARDHFQEFRKLSPGRCCGNVLRGMTWGSIGPGSLGIAYVMEATAEALSAAQGSTASGQGETPFSFEHLFSCEGDNEKRVYTDKALNDHRRARGERLICIFSDARELALDFAYCHVHRTKCPVVDCDILVATTTSTTKSSPHGLVPVLGYLDAHSMSVLIYTCSDNLKEGEELLEGGEKSEKDRFDPLQAELSSRSLEGQCFVLNAKFFGCAQRRRRFYAVYLSVKAYGLSIDYSARDPENIFQTLALLVKLCQRAPTCAKKLLLKDSDPAVERVLLKRVTHSGESQSAKTWGTWVEAHSKAYEEMRLAWNSAPPVPGLT